MPNVFTNLFNKNKSISNSSDSSTNKTKTENSEISTGLSLQSTVRLDTPQILVGVAQSMGIQRETNEDSLFTLTSILNINGEIKNFGLYIIADGMGGHENGEVASRIAIEKMSSHIINKLYLPSVSTDAGPLDEPIQEVMRAGVVKAHQAIKQAAKGSGTTLTAALIIGDQLTIAHVGDSRAYLLEPDGKLKLLTHDHSLVKRLEEIGQLTAEEASKNVKRNLLYRAVGQGDEIDPDVTSFHIFAGQMLFLCTDGLWGVVPEKDIIQAVHASPKPQIVCQKLVDAANSAGGPDNISVILVHFPG